MYLPGEMKVDSRSTRPSFNGQGGGGTGGESVARLARGETCRLPERPLLSDVEVHLHKMI